MKIEFAKGLLASEAVRKMATKEEIDALIEGAFGGFFLGLDKNWLQEACERK